MTFSCPSALAAATSASMPSWPPSASVVAHTEVVGVATEAAVDELQLMRTSAARQAAPFCTADRLAKVGIRLGVRTAFGAARTPVARHPAVAQPV